MKRLDFIPRFLRPKRLRWSKLTDVRNDLSSQRFERIICLSKIYGPMIEKAGREIQDGGVLLAQWETFKSTKQQAENTRNSIRFVPPPECGMRPKRWRRWYYWTEKNASRKREFSHLVHQLHMQFTAVIPYHALQAGVGLTLFDLKLISSPEAYALAQQGLEIFVPGTQATGSTPQDEATVRARVLNIISENRRQTLALSQLEILRDGVTRELLVSATRLMIFIGFLLAVFMIYQWRVKFCLNFPFAMLAACTGGVLGSVISAIVRIGKMLENQDTGRTLVLLGGATRSMYHTPLIGCLAALIFFAFGCLNLLPDLGLLDLHSFACADSCFPCKPVGDAAPKLWPAHFPTRLVLGSFVIGIIAGFSERLVHDLVDRFNKSPPRKTI